LKIEEEQEVWVAGVEVEDEKALHSGNTCRERAAQQLTNAQVG
jgi:hypothetical protein